jgi:hypothetical protein
VPLRPLVFVSGLTFGDYLLWNWSLNTNHDVLALVSGLTLPPLALAALSLLALNLARLLGRSAHRRSARLVRERAHPRAPAAPSSVPAQEHDAAAASAAPPRRIAA